MTIGTANIVAPMLTPSKVVVLISSRMAGQAGFGNLLGGFVLEGNDLCRITFRYVLFAWSVTRLTSGYLVFPTIEITQFGMGSRNKILELIFVAVLTRFASYILIVPGRG
jgi:hypothetical protein